MTIKQQGGIFGRNPSFNNVDVVDLTVSNDLSVADDLSVVGQLTVTGGASAAPSYSFVGDTDTGLSKPTTNAVNIVTGGNEIARFTSSGIDLKYGSLKVINGQGIDFSATAGTGTSELFSDYEEGTWTPTQGGTATLTSSLGLYTKIGRMVHLQFYLTYSSTGTADIGSLPFTANSSAAQAVATIRENNTQGTMWQGRVNNSATTMIIRRYDNANLAVTNGILIGSCTYAV